MPLPIVLKSLALLLSLALSASACTTTEDTRKSEDCEGNLDAFMDQTANFKDASPKSLNRLYAYYKKSGSCDTGIYADTYSDIVTRAVANDPQSALQQMKADGKFKSFVLSHIGVTEEGDDLSVAHQKVSVLCQGGDKDCSELQLALQKAMSN